MDERGEQSIYAEILELLTQGLNQIKTLKQGVY